MASTPIVVDGAKKFDTVCRILERYAYRPAGLIPILQAIQHEYQYLPEEVLTYVATSLDVPPARVFGVATFYAHFALQPKGKHVVRVCDGTACHVKHSLPVLEALHQRLGINDHKKTSPDMLFTVETVACLGACGLAPVLVIDEQVYGGMTPERAVALVDEIVAQERAERPRRRKSMPETLVSIQPAHGEKELAQLRRVIICAGTGCMANGAMRVFERFQIEMAAAGLGMILELRPEAGDGEVRLSKSGCQGFCQMGPLVTVVPDGILYTKVKAEDVPEIVAKSLVGGEVVDRLLYRDPATRKQCRGLEENPFYARQNRRVLGECGFLDPEDIKEYILHGGYRAARKAFVEMSPEESANRSSSPACAAVEAAASRPGANGKRRGHRSQPRNM